MSDVSPSLDIGTIYDHGSGPWSVTIFCYPGGGKEGFARCRTPQSTKPVSCGGSPKSPSGEGEQAGGGKCESTAPRRARTKIRRFVLGAGCDRLLTLTYRENFTDRAASKKHVQLLMRRLRRWADDKDFHWLAVPEYQKRGAIHWHIAINRRFEANQVRSAWHEIIGGQGNIDLQYFHNPAKKAGYLSKYITKDTETDTQRGSDKRYLCSRGLRIPEVYFRAKTQHEAFERFSQETGGQWNGDYVEIEGTYWLPAF